MDIKTPQLVEELRSKANTFLARKVFEEKRLKGVTKEFEQIKNICNRSALEGKTEVILTNWCARKQYTHFSRGTPMSSTLLDRIQKEGLTIREIRREQEDLECEECVRIEFDYVISWVPVCRSECTPPYLPVSN